MIRAKSAISIFVLVALLSLVGGSVVGSQGMGEPPKITLELKGMDVLDVLKLLAKKSGLNIVTSANVRGRVTIFLQDINVWDALRIILEANNLAYEIDGQIIKVVTAREYEALYGRKFHEKTQVKIVQLQHARAIDLGKALNQVKTKVGTIVVDERSNTIILIDIPEKTEEMEELIKKMDVLSITRVFSLNYASVADIEPKISELVTKDVGKIRVDERTNRIVVTDIPRNVETIELIIEAFDEQTPQVLIEAQIIEVVLDDDYAYGINWESVISKDVSITKNLNVSIPGTTASIVGTITPEEISGAVQLLQKFGRTNTLSAPQIVVANNQEAKILVGKKDVYITADLTIADGVTTTTPTVNYIDIGLVLSVTPTINREGFVTMKIKPEVTDFERYEYLYDAQQRQLAKVPVITTTEAETTVMVEDGCTVLIGGLIKDKEVTTIDKVPLLGDIPLLGYLFKSKSREIEKTEMVIFITPRIIETAASFADAGRRAAILEELGKTSNRR